MSREKITTATLLQKKKLGQKIVVVTAYDATMATLLDRAGVDVLMVGDSVGMVVQGHENTLSVTLSEMAYHCRAVVRSGPKAHVVCDMPFLSYQVTDEAALLAAGHLVKDAGAQSVKLEGGRSVASAVKKIVTAGIPVMGHIGLTPQSVHQFGGFRVQGKTRDAAMALVDDALALQQAGAYAIVLEGIPSEVAAVIQKRIEIPTIGIGAGPHTDGQVLVSYDLLGMYSALSPKFVRRYAELGAAVTSAAEAYASDVRDGSFPAPEHGFVMSQGETLPAHAEDE